MGLFDLDAPELRLALSVISGRRTDLQDRELGLLGYDPHKFGAFGRPSLDAVREKAEGILYDHLAAMHRRTIAGLF